MKKASPAALPAQDSTTTATAEDSTMAAAEAAMTGLEDKKTSKILA